MSRHTLCSVPCYAIIETDYVFIAPPALTPLPAPGHALSFPFGYIVPTWRGTTSITRLTKCLYDPLARLHRPHLAGPATEHRSLVKRLPRVMWCSFQASLTALT